MKRAGGFPPSQDDMIPYLYGPAGSKKVKVKVLDYFNMMETDYASPLPPGKSRLIRGACKVCNKLISGSERVNSNFISHLRKSHPETYMDFEIKTGRIHRTAAKAVVRSSMAASTSSPYYPASPNATLSIAALDEVTHGVVMPKTLPPQLTPAYRHDNAALSGQTSAPHKHYSSSPATISSAGSSGSTYKYELAKSPPSRQHIPTSTVIDFTSSEAEDEVSVKSEPGQKGKAVELMARRWSADTRQETQVTKSPALTEVLVDLVIGDLLSPYIMNSPRFQTLLQLTGVDSDSLPTSELLQQAINTRSQLTKSKSSSQLASVHFACMSQELKDTLNPTTKHLSFSAHFIQDWTYYHKMISSHTLTLEQATERTHWELLKVTAMEKLGSHGSPASVIEVINHLTGVRRLPGFYQSGLDCKSELNIPTGQLSYASLLDQAVISAVERCGSGLLSVITVASKLVVTSHQIDWECDTSNAKDLPWFRQLTLISKTVNMTETVKAVFDSLGLADEFLTEAQRSLLSVVVDVLRPFQEVAERIRSNGNVTCSLAFASIRLLKSALVDYTQAYPDTELISYLTEEFQKATDSIDNAEENSYTTATILDPRFKLQWCEAEKQESFKRGLIASAKEAVVKKQQPIASEEVSRPVFPQSGGFFTRILKQQPEADIITSNITSEVFRYFEESLMPEDCEIMHYWKSNQLNYPNLSVLAQRYLSIPTSPSDISGYYDTENQLFDIHSTNIDGDILNKAIELRPTIRSDH